LSDAESAQTDNSARHKANYSTFIEPALATVVPHKKSPGILKCRGLILGSLNRVHPPPQTIQDFSFRDLIRFRHHRQRGEKFGSAVDIVGERMSIAIVTHPHF
jgi:hypothetical protein